MRVHLEQLNHGSFGFHFFTSIAVLDEASLLATCAYIDLNPVAAGKCSVPEKSEHTSVKSRVEHVKSKGRLAAVTSDSPYVGSRDHEHDHWLCPIENRSRRGAQRIVVSLFKCGPASPTSGKRVSAKPAYTV